MDNEGKFWAYLWSLGAGTILVLVFVLSYRGLVETKLYAKSANPIALACAKEAGNSYMTPVCVTYFQTK
jgi:hypothetical protein